MTHQRCHDHDDYHHLPNSIFRTVGDVCGSSADEDTWKLIPTPANLKLQSSRWLHSFVIGIYANHTHTHTHITRNHKHAYSQADRQKTDAHALYESVLQPAWPETEALVKQNEILADFVEQTQSYAISEVQGLLSDLAQCLQQEYRIGNLPKFSSFQGLTPNFGLETGSLFPRA